MPGNKTKLTDEKVKELCKVIEDGNYVCVACDYMGIPQGTFYRWLEEAEQEESIEYVNLNEFQRLKRELNEGIKKARAAAETRNVDIIKKAGETTWQASAWWLERTKYERWGRKQQFDLGKETVNSFSEWIKQLKDEEE